MSNICSTKAVISSKGQLVIPKNLRQFLGLHTGIEVFLRIKENGVLELQPVKRSINLFFGRCKDALKEDFYEDKISQDDLCIMDVTLQNDNLTVQ